jgi:hypothetical protein
MQPLMAVTSSFIKKYAANPPTDLRGIEKGGMAP